MSARLSELVEQWCDASGVETSMRPDRPALAAGFPDDDACRPGIARSELAAWEFRHGFTLPTGVKRWLELSDGLFRAHSPLIHPLSAIGPIVPFARVPGLLMEPESWFELGNPNRETICLDLGYRWPDGDSTVFTSGDDEQRSRPRIVDHGFDAWFLRVLCEGGREYWFDHDFRDLGDPWYEHRRHVPAPELADRLRLLAARVWSMILEGIDDRQIATRFGINRFEVEAIVRFVQHTRPPRAEPAARRAL